MKSLIVAILATILSFATADPLNVADFSDGLCTRPPPAHNFSSVLPLVNCRKSKSCTYSNTHLGSNYIPIFAVRHATSLRVLFDEQVMCPEVLRDLQQWHPSTRLGSGERYLLQHNVCRNSGSPEWL